jgi:hypothetical protein
MVEKMISANLRGGRALRISFVIEAFIVFIILLTGCVSKPGEKETPAVTQPTVPPPAPKQLYIKAGQHEQFTYWGHGIGVNYTSAYPTQIFKVAVDGNEKLLQKEPTESPNGIYWKEGNLSFTLKPVVWETREGQKVPVYESTWNTSEVYFEVQIISLPSGVSGGPKP